MDRTVPGNPGYQVKRFPLLVVRFKREPDNKVNDRHKRVLPAQVDSTEDICDRMPAAEFFKDCIAAGLGTEMEFCVGAILRYERKRFVADKFRADLARERAKEDLVPAGSEQVLYLVPAGVYAIRSIGKCIGREETRLFMTVGKPGNFANRTVPHAMAEDLRGLA